MVYKLICCECSNYMVPFYSKIKDSFIQCSKCGNSTFKIEITKGSHHESTTCKITCICCNEYLALNYSKVKELSFPFIQCPTCGKFKFKIEIIKKYVTGHTRSNTLNIRTQRLYNDEYERKKEIKK